MENDVEYVKAGGSVLGLEMMDGEGEIPVERAGGKLGEEGEADKVFLMGVFSEEVANVAIWDLFLELDQR